MKKILMSLAMLALIAVPAAAHEGEDHAETGPQAVVGQPAPDFAATDTMGRTQSLSGHKGKVVVLEWTNPECPYVKKHYGSNNMQDLQKYAAEHDAVWLRIVSSAPGKQGHMSVGEANRKAELQHVAATGTILDEDGHIGKLYGAQTTPHMFVINAEGTLVYAGAIDDNASSDPETINGAQNYVKTVLDDLRLGRVVAVDTTKPYGCGVKYAD